jgi:hypothetical protein
MHRLSKMNGQSLPLPQTVGQYRLGVLLGKTHGHNRRHTRTNNPIRQPMKSFSYQVNALKQQVANLHPFEIRVDALFRRKINELKP